MQDYFVEQADYQHWASQELFRSLDDLSDTLRRQDQGLFFHNIHKTVDHILVVTRNWRARLAQRFDDVTPYDILLYQDWTELKTALLDEFSSLRDSLAAAEPSWFDQHIEYPGSGGNTQSTTVTDGLTHVMIHAAHHRGQISTVCTQLGAPSPEMDFVFYRRRTQGA